MSPGPEVSGPGPARLVGDLPGEVGPAPVPASGDRRRLASAWNAAGTAVTGLLGLAPHVLHHVGLFAGAFLVTGAIGNAIFGIAGLVLSIPFLIRLYRRHRTWQAPAIAVAVFVTVFSLSAFVIGPAITGSSDDSGPARPPSPDQHSQHHSG